MSANPRKIACNIEINKGSILLLFNEQDAEIVRNWKNAVKSDEAIEGVDRLTP